MIKYFHLFFFLFLILLLGLFSDLKHIKSALSRFIIQISLVLSFVIFNDLQLIEYKNLFTRSTSL